MAPASRSSDTVDPLVLVIDHDMEARQLIGGLLASVGLKARLYDSPTDLLSAGRPNAPSCVVMEFRLPRMNGLEVQSRLRQLQIHVPVIFVSGYGDVALAVRAMKEGAVDFLPKPIREQDLLDAVHSALELDRRARAELAGRAELDRLFASLTAREREVMHHVTAGLMNKQVAFRMGLSEITVKVHRGNVMRKMHAKSLADLVCKARALFRPRHLDLTSIEPDREWEQPPLRTIVVTPGWSYAA